MWNRGLNLGWGLGFGRGRNAWRGVDLEKGEADFGGWE